jgi:hypothetical protein
MNNSSSGLYLFWIIIILSVKILAISLSLELMAFNSIIFRDLMNSDKANQVGFQFLCGVQKEETEVQARTSLSASPALSLFCGKLSV